MLFCFSFFANVNMDNGQEVSNLQLTNCFYAIEKTKHVHNDIGVINSEAA